MPRKKSDTVQLKVRMKEPLRARLEKAAKSKGLSLNAEAVARLEQSFHDEKALQREFGGEKALLFGKWFAVTLASAQQMTKQSWEDDAETFLIAVEAMRVLRLKGLEEKDIPDEEDLKYFGEELAEVVFSRPSRQRRGK